MKTKAQKVLEEYMLFNIRKTDMSSEKTTMSTHLYGTMVIALAMDSEFKLSNDFSDLLKKILLGVQDYDSKNDILMLKYEIMEYALSKELSRTSNIEEVYEKTKKLFGSRSESKCKNVIKFFKHNMVLHEKKRSGWDSHHWDVSGKIETVSDYVYSTMKLAHAINKHYNLDVNIDKVLKMLLVHEFGEILIGDITPFDNVTVEEKKSIEHKAFKNVVSMLSNREELYNLMIEFDEHTTKESKFAYMCDKLEAPLQAKVYFDKGRFKELNEYTNNIVLTDPEIKKFIKNGASNAYQIWYFYNIGLINDEIYKDIILTSKYTNTNLIKVYRYINI